MDPNNMTSLTPQQLAQLLPGHLTTGANGQPVTVLLDYGPAGQQQIQLQTLPVTPVLEPSRKDGTLDDTIDQVVGHQQPLYVYNPPNGTPAENSTSAAVKVPPKENLELKLLSPNQKTVDNP
uniref:Uncharacterized protein n=1 Tax=Ditylenchus dipsaci TaxID=166011 RepID=A0A915D4Q7_9BILA